MRIVKITADIYSGLESQNSTYRMHVDFDMLTERTFTWDAEKHFITEHLVVNLAPGEHCVSCEAIRGITMKNVTVDGIPSTPVFTI